MEPSFYTWHQLQETLFSFIHCILTCTPLISLTLTLSLPNLHLESHYITTFVIPLPTENRTSYLVNKLVLDQQHETLLSVISGNIFYYLMNTDTQSGSSRIDRWESQDKLTWKSSAQLLLPSSEVPVLNSLHASNGILLLTYENGMVELRDSKTLELIGNKDTLKTKRQAPKSNDKPSKHQNSFSFDTCGISSSGCFSPNGMCLCVVEYPAKFKIYCVRQHIDLEGSIDSLSLNRI